METEMLLPLGTIVRTKGNVKKLLIIGRALKVKIDSKEEQEYFDYSAVTYPEGMVGDRCLYINHGDIDEIIYRGFEDEENARMVNMIKKAVATYEHDSYS